MPTLSAGSHPGGCAPAPSAALLRHAGSFGPSGKRAPTSTHPRCCSTSGPRSSKLSAAHVLRQFVVGAVVVTEFDDVAGDVEPLACARLDLGHRRVDVGHRN